MSAMVYAVIDTNILVSARISKNPLAATVKVVASMFHYLKPFILCKDSANREQSIKLA